MSKFSDLPANATPSNDDIIAIEQDADGLNRKVKLNELPIVTELASTATGEGASKVGVEDSAGNFAGTNVETVLAEIYAKMDGIDSWVSGTTYTAPDDVVLLASNNVIYRCIVTNSDVTFTPANWQAIGKDTHTIADDTATGSNVTLTAPTTDLVRLTDGSLVSIDMIPAGSTGNPIWLINDTGVDITINDETGATATDRIKTGQAGPLTLADQAAIQVIYDSTDSRWQIVGGTGSGEGGAGSLDSFDTETFEAYASANASGNNSAFLGGGSVNGSESLETSVQISGTQSWKFTAGASSNNDYFEIKTIDLDLKQRGTDIKVRMSADMSGFANDVTFVCYDKTNSSVISSSLDILTASTDRTFYEFSFFTPSTCAQISFGFHMNNGATNTESFLADDIEWSTNPFFSADLSAMSEWTSFTPTAQNFGTITNALGQYRRVGDSMELQVWFNAGVPTGSAAIVDLPAGLSVDTAKLPSSSTNKNLVGHFLRINGGVSLQGQAGYYAHVNPSNPTEIRMSSVPSNQSGHDDEAANNWLTGDGISLIATVPIEGWSHTATHVITPAKSNLTDFIPYTPTITGFGTESAVDFYYKQIGDAYHIQGVFTSGTPTAVEAQISLPNSKSVKTGVTTKHAGVYFAGSGASNGGAALITGGDSFINLSIASVFNVASVDPLTPVNASAITLNGDEVSINVIIPIEGLSSDVNYLAAEPIQRVVYLKDTQASGSTGGGTFTQGSYQTRDLNKVEGDSSIVSLSANQFTLGAGKYSIDGRSAHYGVSTNKLQLYNVSDSVVVAVGLNSNSSLTQGGEAHLSTPLEITSSKTFEWRHRCNTTRATDGLGLPATHGVDEVYTEIKITKLR